jgi:hypothetical protein
MKKGRRRELKNRMPPSNRGECVPCEHLIPKNTAGSTAESSEWLPNTTGRLPEIKATSMVARIPSDILTISILRFVGLRLGARLRLIISARTIPEATLHTMMEKVRRTGLGLDTTAQINKSPGVGKVGNEFLYACIFSCPEKME